MAVPPFLRVEDVAALLGCSVRSVHELARKSMIPHRQWARRGALLFPEDEIRAWLDGCELAVSVSPTGGRIVRPKATAS